MLELQTRHGLIRYHEYGAGFPLVLLHANPGDHHDFDAIIPELAKKFKLIAIDWPGYGESPAPHALRNTSAMLFADMLEDVIAALPYKRLILLGNSVGAFSAARLAISSQERVQALILVSPGGFTTYNIASRLFCQFKGNENVTRLIAPLFARLYLKKRNDYVYQILARTYAGCANPATVAVDAAIWRSFIDPQHDLRIKANAIVAPTLIICGQFDPVISAKRDGHTASETIPNSNLVILPTGHEPFAETPELFLGAIAPFLSQHLNN